MTCLYKDNLASVSDDLTDDVAAVRQQEISMGTFALKEDEFVTVHFNISYDHDEYKIVK